MEKRRIEEIFDVLDGIFNEKPMSIEEIYNELIAMEGFDPSLENLVDLYNGPLQNALKGCVNNELAMVVGVYYKFIEMYPMVRAFEENGGKLKNVSDIYGMQANLNYIKSLHDAISKHYIRRKSKLLDENFKKNNSQFDQLLDDALNVAGKATYLRNYRGKGALDKKYIKELRNSLISVMGSVNSTAESIECLGCFNSAFIEKYNLMADDYKKFYELVMPIIDDIEFDLKEIKNTQQEEKNIEKNKSLHQSKTVIPVEKPEEKEKLNLITRVNDLYDRFQVECMRELKKEVSMMNRDAYNHLMDKIDKFLKSFPMPLSNNISMGMAKEALGQVNKLYDMFTEISYNTYNPSLPYGTRSFE